MSSPSLHVPVMSNVDATISPPTSTSSFLFWTGPQMDRGPTLDGGELNVGSVFDCEEIARLAAERRTIAVSVENRMAFARSFFKIERLTIGMPTLSESSVSVI